MRSKIYFFILASACTLFATFQLSAQTTLTTLPNPPYSGTNSLTGPAQVSFVLRNNNAGSVLLTGISNWATTAENNSVWQLYYTATALSGSATNVTIAPWTLIATSAPTPVVATGITPINFPGLSFNIPAGTQYRFALRNMGPGLVRYSGTGTALTPNTFSGGGVDLLVGNVQIAGLQVGYSGSGTALTLTPRYFTGSVTFVPGVIPTCTLTCPANIVVSNEPNQCGAIVNFPPATTSGTCGPVIAVPASGSFFPVGLTTVNVTATGGGSCSFTVRVNDTQLPTLGPCPANITTTNSPGQCGRVVTFTLPPASDNCPGVTVSSVPASGSLFPVGTTTVTVRATDASGNTSTTCQFTVTVTDTQAPTITCPANVTVNNTPGLCSAVVNYTLPTVVDNCVVSGPYFLTQSSSQTVTPGSVACAAAGFHTNNSYWRAYDLGALGLPGPLTINTVSFGIELADASGTGTTQPVTVRLHTSAGAFPGGVRTMVGSQIFNIPDQTNSVFTGTLTTPVTVPANAILVLEVFTPDGRTPVNNRFYIGSNSAPETAPSYISAPDCAINTPTPFAGIGFPNVHIILNATGVVGGPSPLTLVSGLPSGAAFPIGTTTNTYRATDGAGNTSTCSFTVTVVDNQLPVITCPANITVTSPVGSCVATVNYAVTATDNCPGVTTALQSGLASGSAFPLGATTVTWRATDASGNISTCSFTVTVLDGQLPVISLHPANNTSCVGSNASFSVTTSNALGYQWQTFSGGTWNNIPGATGPTYTVNNVTTSMNTNTFRVIVTGLCTTVTSGFATLFVNTLPVITLSSSIPPMLLPGQFLDITATGIPPGGSFVWLFNGVVMPGVTGNTLTNIGVNGIGSYSVRYTDLNGCVTTSAVLVVSGMNSDNLFVYPNPNFGQFQVRFFNQANENATVNVYNSIGQKVYQKAMVTTIAYTQIDIDLGSDASGMYVVELVNAAGKRVGARQVIVRHR